MLLFVASLNATLYWKYIKTPRYKYFTRYPPIIFFRFPSRLNAIHSRLVRVILNFSDEKSVRYDHMRPTSWISQSTSKWHRPTKNNQLKPKQNNWIAGGINIRLRKTRFQYRNPILWRNPFFACAGLYTFAHSLRSKRRLHCKRAKISYLKYQFWQQTSHQACCA